MAVLSTEPYRFSNLVKKTLWPELGFNFEAVTCNEAGATTYVVGTALGKVTATGKYKVSVQTAVDGSENVVALVVEDKTLAAATDTKVKVAFRGPMMVSKNAVVLDATYNLDAEKAAAYASLATVGIIVCDTV